MAIQALSFGWKERLVVFGGFCTLAIMVNVIMFHRMNTHTHAEPLPMQPERPTDAFLDQFGIVMVAVANIWDENLIRYCDWAMLSCQSVRRNGKYEGPLFVVTNYDLSADRYQEMIAKYNITIIQVEVPREAIEKSKMYGQRYKMLSVALVPKTIRYLLYIDADVLIGRNLDRFLAMGNTYMDSCTALFFQGRNRAQKPNQPFQGGTFFVDLKYGMPLMREWEHTLMTRALPKDQIALYMTVLERLSQYSPKAIKAIRKEIDRTGNAFVQTKWNGNLIERSLGEKEAQKFWWRADSKHKPPKEQELCRVRHKHDWVLFPFPDTMARGEKNDLNHITFTGFLRKVTEAQLLNYLRNTLLLDPTGLELYFPIPFESDIAKAAERTAGTFN